MSTFNHHLPLLGKCSKMGGKSGENTSQNLGLAGLMVIYTCFLSAGKRRRASHKPVVRTEAEKTFMINKLPKVLRLHLKRFRYVQFWLHLPTLFKNCDFQVLYMTISMTQFIFRASKFRLTSTTCSDKMCPNYAEKQKKNLPKIGIKNTGCSDVHVMRNLQN
jgi:hypothetical protein